MIPRSWRIPILAAVVVGTLLQLRISQAPMQPYGWDGAEYIEHVARLEYVQLLRSDKELGALETFREMDSAFPPLLHVMTTPLATVGGHGAGFAARSATLWLFLLALAVGVVGRRLGGDSAGLAAGVGTLLLPALQGYATRYYYDIPMTALLWATVAAALVFWPRRPAVGGLLVGVLWMAAILTKWTALPFGLFMVLGAFFTVLRVQSGGAGRVRAPAIALALACVVTATTVFGYISLQGEGSSLHVMLEQMWASLGDAALSDSSRGGLTSWFSDQGAGMSAGIDGAKLLFYPASLVTSVFSPLLGSAALLLSVLWLLRSRAGLGLWLATVGGQWLFLIVLVPLADERFLVTLAPAIVLSAALGLSSLSRRWRRGTAGLLLAAGLLVALEFHLAAPTLPLLYERGGDTGQRDVSLFFSTPDRSAGWRAFELIPSGDGLLPPIVLRGLGAAGSVEDRGWVPRSDERSWGATEAEAAWEALASLESSETWIARARDRGEAAALGSQWLAYRQLLDELSPEPSSLLFVFGCEDAAQAQAALTPTADGDEAQVDPCMGPEQDWKKIDSLASPDGSGWLTLWSRVPD